MPRINRRVVLLNAVGDSGISAILNLTLLSYCAMILLLHLTHFWRMVSMARCWLQLSMLDILCYFMFIVLMSVWHLAVTLAFFDIMINFSFTSYCCLLLCQMVHRHHCVRWFTDVITYTLCRIGCKKIRQFCVLGCAPSNFFAILS
jgi:hypothetical protein